MVGITGILLDAHDAISLRTKPQGAILIGQQGADGVMQWNREIALQDVAETGRLVIQHLDALTICADPIDILLLIDHSPKHA